MRGSPGAAFLSFARNSWHFCGCNSTFAALARFHGISVWPIVSIRRDVDVNMAVDPAQTNYEAGEGAWYLDDTYEVAGKLTLTLGPRWEGSRILTVRSAGFHVAESEKLQFRMARVRVRVKTPE